MVWNKALVVCLAAASLAAAQVTPGPALPRTPRGRSVITRNAPRGYLGVGLKTETAGIEVTNVNDNSPAEKAGIKVGDILLEINGQKIEDLDEFIQRIGDTTPGTKVNLTLLRDGSKLNVTASVQSRPLQAFAMGGEMPQVFRFPEAPDSPLFGIQSPRIGFEGETLTAQLAEFFGVKEGVLVRSVNANTPASKAGLKAGDVITKVSGTPVSSPREISGMVRMGRRPLTFTVMRNHKEITLNVEIAQSRPLFVPERESL